MNKEVEYLKEHLYEIYKYKKSMKDLTYDMDIEHLLRTCKALDYSQKEIERLNNIIDEFEDWLGKQRIRNCEWDNFVIKDTRLGIPITYLLNKLKELKDSD